MAPLVRFFAMCLLVHCSNLLTVQSVPTSRLTRARRRNDGDTRYDGHSWPEPPSAEPSNGGIVEDYQWMKQHGGRSVKQAEVDRRELVDMMMGVAAWLDRLLVKTSAHPNTQQDLARGENQHNDIYGYATDDESRRRSDVLNYRSGDNIVGPPATKLLARPKVRCVRKRQTTSSGGTFGAFGHRDPAAFIGVGSGGFRGAGSGRSTWSQQPAGSFGDFRGVSGSRHGTGKHAGFIPHRDADNPITAGDRVQKLNPPIIWHSSALPRDQLGVRLRPAIESESRVRTQGRQSVVPEGRSPDC